VVYRLDTPGVEDQAITNEKIKVNAVSDTKIDNTISNALVPIGGIIMWSGAQADLPANWKICDGTVYGSGASQVITPNLVDKFVIAGGTYDAVEELWKTSIGGTAQSEGGAATKTLASTELPSHTHDITDPGHQHTTNVDTGKLFHAGGVADAIQYGGSGDYPGTAFNMDDANTGITATDGQSGTTGQAFDILPPYFAIAYIMRIS